MSNPIIAPNDPKHTPYFSIEEDEITKLNGWISYHDKTCICLKRQGSIGGRLTYEFTPTTIGTFVHVSCACGAKQSLTDFDKM